MIDDKTWDKFVDDFDTYRGKKKVSITNTNGDTYEGICNGYVEDEDSKGDSVWAICIKCGEYFDDKESKVITYGRRFTQEMVDKIEFLN